MTRILLQGIGGIGGWLAAELIRSRQDVTLVTGNPAITAAINSRGITLTTPERRFHVDARAATTVADLPRGARYDCAFLAMMAGHVVTAAREAVTRLHPDGYCVAFQNGFVEDAIGAAIGASRVVGATVALGSTMEAPGIYHRTTPGKLIIGELDGARSARVTALRDLLAHVIDTDISTNIVGVLWGKLVWNGAVSGLCAVSGYRLGELFASAAGRELFIVAFRESVGTARAQGVTIEPVIVAPDDYFEPVNATRAAHAALLARLQPFVEKYAGVTPSTLESLKRGRRSEIDFLNGHIRECARRCGIDVPLNDALIPMVHDIENGRRAIAPSNLDELARAL